MPEQVGHGLLVVNSPDGFGQEDGDVDCLDLVTLQLLHVVGHSVRHNNLKAVIFMT